MQNTFQEIKRRTRDRSKDIRMTHILAGCPAPQHTQADRLTSIVDERSRTPVQTPLL